MTLRTSDSSVADAWRGQAGAGLNAPGCSPVRVPQAVGRKVAR